MNVVTVNVGQGALAIVRHNKEAIVVDSRVPPNDETVSFVKEMLALSLKDHGVKGFILTGFDSDHSDTVGVSLVLRKYRPDWIMYPSYYKDSEEASDVFQIIDEEEKLRRNSGSPLQRISVLLDQKNSLKPSGLSANFSFEIFSPHCDDLNCSNNGSIVLKLTGLGSGGFSYLITGDTENDRWETISKLHGAALKSHVLAAPHHGSKNATHPASLLHIAPHTVLISAGVDNQYGHPDPEALKVYAKIAKHIYATNVNGGVSLLTEPGPTEITTSLLPSRSNDQ